MAHLLLWSSSRDVRKESLRAPWCQLQWTAGGGAAEVSASLDGLKRVDSSSSFLVHKQKMNQNVFGLVGAHKTRVQRNVFIPAFSDSAELLVDIHRG